MNKLFDRNELKRLEKSVKDKNKMKIYEWANQFEAQIREQYEKEFKNELADSIDNFLIAIIYTLHFNEKCRFGNDRISDFMEDLMSTVECFKNGDYSPKEYKDILAKRKIYFKER